jgi:phage-related tail fiber protein
MTSKPQKMGVTWASQAPIDNILDPDSVVGGKVDTGWLVEIPSLQFFNWIQNNISARCAYINTLGISEWDADTIYPVGAWVNVPSMSKIFKSTVSNNQGVDPTSGASDWADITILGGEEIGDEIITYDSIANMTFRGYLPENGQAISRTTYAQLFALIGTTFGPGDGSTTFNLPSKNGGVPLSPYYIKALG